MLVAKLEPVMDVVADGLHACPARLRAAEKRPSLAAKSVSVAISATQKENQDVVGEILESVLLGFRNDQIRMPAISNNELIREGDPTGWRGDPGAQIAKPMAITGLQGQIPW